MRLPGTRYQEHGWEQVRKLLGQCSLQAFAANPASDLLAALASDPAACLDQYVERTAAIMHAGARNARAAAPGNSYGDSVLELALGLLYELRERHGDWLAFAAAVAHDAARLGPAWRQGGGEAILRKKFNDMYAVLRDKVDADNYMAACGAACSANRMYAYRMLDTAYADIARLFDSWREFPEQVGAILGRPVGRPVGAAAPIEVRQLKSIGQCRGAWVIAWSDSREAFTGAPGPLNTRSKRFASLKNQPEKISAMLREIGDYEELSANCDSAWAHDAHDAGEWLSELARVLEAPDIPAGDDRLLPAPAADELEDREDKDDDDDIENTAANSASHSAAEQQAAGAVSLPPSYLAMARLAEHTASWSARTMAPWSMPVRLAVYLKLLGGYDDCYPAEWLDPATGELPNMQQLAVLDGLSLPTLRKRRDAAIAALQGAEAPSNTRSVK
jgi:hypothetical protein